MLAKEQDVNKVSHLNHQYENEHNENKKVKKPPGSLPCHPFSQVMTSTDMLSDELHLHQDPWSSTYRAVLGCEEKLRPVCVQVLRADGVPGDSKAEVEDLIENLAEEAEKMAGLSHPNIAQVVGYAKDEDARMGCLVIDCHGDVGSRSVLVGISFQGRLMDCGLFRLKRGGRSTGGAAGSGREGELLVELLTGVVRGGEEEGGGRAKWGELGGLGEGRELEWDSRAGCWGEGCKEGMMGVLESCWRRNKGPGDTLAAVSSRMRGVERKYCQPTREEALLRQMEEAREELEKLKLEGERRRLQGRVRAGECLVCLEEAEEGVVCSSSAHFICSECLPQEVGRVLELAETEGGIRRGCGGVYTDKDLAGALTAEKFERLMECRRRSMRSEVFAEVMGRMKDLKLEGEEAATRELIRLQHPDALQCPRCHTGPVLPEGCSDLGMHHQEWFKGAMFSNACRACGFFDRDRNNWEKWDGRMTGQREQGRQGGAAAAAAGAFGRTQLRTRLKRRVVIRHDSTEEEDEEQDEDQDWYDVVNEIIEQELHGGLYDDGDDDGDSDDDGDEDDNHNDNDNDEDGYSDDNGDGNDDGDGYGDDNHKDNNYEREGEGDEDEDSDDNKGDDNDDRDENEDDDHKDSDDGDDTDGDDDEDSTDNEDSTVDEDSTDDDGPEQEQDGRPAVLGGATQPVPVRQEQDHPQIIGVCKSTGQVCKNCLNDRGCRWAYQPDKWPGHVSW
ncbi:hypothetical protein GUITHDRAFT_149006 [Guillardia theta CCMP2712]|uniref:Protein kinase domain-containing protein n=1 Tax=Guillardia theta (strain CCMP2712) TaxID=905079 RepID=L1I6M3_GUITC|nr:hypothetical protein GUITHDRAFT_149006 [Guillardia theta CCMP2712]EKX31881.1 hypothetical protein GUITHDRAFT_149006 [Guillardia theta CCMP2712]|eukprot:XP_005818861.1 hypothetical protein GUITHDRAFT_149006 [Guillardia theta CCMP2712]